MKFLSAALIAASVIFLFGCVTVSPPENCAPLPADEQPGCVYYSAVMSQDPYACYALQNESQRTVCLKDAIDPSAKKLIAKKTIVVAESGTLTNESAGIRAPPASPQTGQTGILGNSTQPEGNSTQPEGNGTAPVKSVGIMNPA